MRRWDDSINMDLKEMNCWIWNAGIDSNPVGNSRPREHGNAYIGSTKDKILSPLYNLSCRNVDGWGTAPQDGRLRFGFPMMSLQIFISVNIPAVIFPLARFELWHKLVRGIFPGRANKAGYKADEFPTFPYWQSWYLGNPYSWNSHRMSSKDLELLAFTFTFILYR